MIVAIHQPHFLPWLGYMDRMRRCDLFIVLDHVQFERQNFQNRVRVKTNHGPRWLTVPVQKGSQKDSILDKFLADEEEGETSWGRRAFQTLWHPYRRAPHFDAYAAAVKGLLETRWERLIDLNLKSMDLLREFLDIRTPVVRSSEMGVSGQKSDLILNLCKAAGADAFLAGLGGSRHYLDAEAFDRAGIRILHQEFVHPRYHQQPKPENFVEGLSALDLLFNCGPRSAQVLADGGREAAFAAPQA